MHIKLRSGYSFRYAFGKIIQTLDIIQGSFSQEMAKTQGMFAGLCDRNGTWGHIAWSKACKERGIKPIYGVELACVEDMESRTKQAANWMTFIALSHHGLQEIHELVAIATEKFYYHPRIDTTVISQLSSEVAILSGDNLIVIHDYLDELAQREHFYLELSPTLHPSYISDRFKWVSTTNNLYAAETQLNAYQIAVGDHYENTLEPRAIGKLDPRGIANNITLANLAHVELKKAIMVKPKTDSTLKQLCDNICSLNPDRYQKNDEYKNRLQRELDVIQQKDFEDYFLVVYDLVSHARERMLVGPARGSSCGSLVCYILGITTVDPIEYGLLFERFIDLNRNDLPDIDIDFPDTKRDEIYKYLQNKYGHECVAKLGTISRFKPKSALLDTCKALSIPLHATDKVKNAIIEKYPGDAGFTSCLDATFRATREGQEFLNRYPEVSLACEIEGHARHSGVHAAGIVVSNDDLSNYCSIDERLGAIQLEKYEAESIGLLKIDVLGLRTLTVIEDILEQINQPHDFIFNLPLDNTEAFKTLNDKKYTGIFQFEGNALQSISSQMRVESFEDIAALTALGRPGPMQCGGTKEYLLCRTGRKKARYVHPLIKKITSSTYGVIVYQEQVMQIGRLVGDMSWEEVSVLRKAMSKSKGQEFFNQLFEKFKQGALKNGLTEPQVKYLWEQMKTMGAYAFNRSHAVAYAMISYWCMYLKALHPMEFYCACLRHAKDNEQVIAILRELDKFNIKFKVFDPIRSTENWVVTSDNVIVGGLLNIKGIGFNTAQEIIRKRNEGEPFTTRQQYLLDHGETPFDNIFETREQWGHLMEMPGKYNIRSRLDFIENITSEYEGEVVVICRLHDFVLKDMNSKENVEKRGSRLPGPTAYLVCKASDDTGTITCVIGRYNFEKFGNNLLEFHTEGDYYIIKGTSSCDFKTINVDRYKKLTGNNEFKKAVNDGI